MLNVGETQAPYEPYAGNQPSPNPDYPQEIKIPGSDGSLEVRVFGAQLIAKTYASATINGITYTVNDDGSVTANGKATSNSFFLLSMLPKANDVFLSGGKSESISIVYTNMVNKGYYDQWYENALVQMIFMHNFKLKYFDVCDYHWTEVDNVDDLLNAKQIHLTK